MRHARTPQRGALQDVRKVLFWLEVAPTNRRADAPWLAHSPREICPTPSLVSPLPLPSCRGGVIGVDCGVGLRSGATRRASTSCSVVELALCTQVVSSGQHSWHREMKIQPEESNENDRSIRIPCAGHTSPCWQRQACMQATSRADAGYVTGLMSTGKLSVPLRAPLSPLTTCGSRH